MSISMFSKNAFVTALLALMLIISACDLPTERKGLNKSTTSDELNKEHCKAVYTPIAPSRTYDASDIETAINNLIKYRNLNLDCKRKDVDLVAESQKLIKLIDEHKALNVRTKTKFYLLLYQYSDASSAEDLYEMLGRLCSKHPRDVIDALVGIETYLLPGFRNVQFYEGLYSSACGYPRSISESDGFDRAKENKSRIAILKKIEYSGNAHVVKYLIENVYNK